MKLFQLSELISRFYFNLIVISFVIRLYQKIRLIIFSFRKDYHKNRKMIPSLLKELKNDHLITANQLTDGEYLLIVNVD